MHTEPLVRCLHFCIRFAIMVGSERTERESMDVVYILRCADETYYTGWTNDMTARLTAHNRGVVGAKYTRPRRPVQLAYCEPQPDRIAAMKREAEIKAYSRSRKQQLIDTMCSGERLAIYDQDERMCGMMPRTLVHQVGLRHHVCHLWLVQERDGVLGHWLQQRGFDRPLYPGKYDLAATGHIDPGETALEGALREAREEIGLHFTPEQVLAIGIAGQKYPRPDGGLDDELVHAFVVRVDDTPDFAIGSEVERMLWVPFETFYRAETGADQIEVQGETIRTEQMCCLHKGEWALFERHLRKTMSKSEKNC